MSFVSPARFGERLEIEARVGWVSRSSFGMTYRITAPERDGAAAGRDRGRATRLGDPALISYGETVQVMFDYASGKVRPIPTDLIGRLEAYEGRRFRALSRD